MAMTVIEVSEESGSLTVQRKNVEAIALDQNIAPQTLQRLLDSIAWDHKKLRDTRQQIVATERRIPMPLAALMKQAPNKSRRNG